MALKVVTPDQMQELDQTMITDVGIPAAVLMENAAHLVTDAVVEMLGSKSPGRVWVMCGTGNNGGDGLACARQLHRLGVLVRIFLIGDKAHMQAEARIHLNILQKAGLTIEEVRTEADFQRAITAQRLPHVMVDAIFGTGLDRDVEGMLFTIIQAINAMQCPVCAIDVPSGIDSHTGDVLGVAVKATTTVAIEYIKLGHLLFPGRDYCGKLECGAIGILPPHAESRLPYEMLQLSDIQKLLPKRRPNTHKGSYGSLMIFTGGQGMVGAGVLCAQAALRVGVGKATLGVPKSLYFAYASQMQETMVYPLEDESGFIAESAVSVVDNLLKDKRAVVVGPGMGKMKGTYALLDHILNSTDLPAIVDADGLNVMAANMDILSPQRGNVVLTPHAGEMARLMGCQVHEILEDPLEMALKLARERNCTVLLKSATSIIASPEGNVTVNIKGTSGQAKAGSGDVLSGVIGALLCQGLSAYDAARLGAYLCGYAVELGTQDIGAISWLASDTIRMLPYALKASSPNSL